MTSKRTQNGWGARHGSKWSSAEEARLAKLRFDGTSWDDIAATLKRSKASCQLKYHYVTHGGRKYAPTREQVRLARVVPQQLRTDLTGIILGDPAPGRSALEQKRRRKRPISLAPVLTGASA